MVWGERYTLVRGSPTHCHEMTLETIAKCILPVTEQPVPRHFAVIVSIKTNTIIPTNKLFRKLSKMTIHVTACESCCDTVLGRNSAGFKLFSAIPESSSGCEEVKATVLLKMMPELYSLWHFVAVTINGHVKMMAGWKKKSTKNSATVLGLDMALTQMHTHAHRDIYTNTHTHVDTRSVQVQVQFLCRSISISRVCGPFPEILRRTKWEVTVKLHLWMGPCDVGLLSLSPWLTWHHWPESKISWH